MYTLTQLCTVKARLGLADSTDDIVLHNAIQGISTQFERFCNRVLARTVEAKDEFNADMTQVPLGCYPIETISWFELKSREDEGWIRIAPDPIFLVKSRCVLSLLRQLGSCNQRARVVYTGGYVLPGTVPEVGQTALPADIEQACVEQVAYWYQNRTKVAPLYTVQALGTAQQITQIDLLPSVLTVLKFYRRWTC